MEVWIRADLKKIWDHTDEIDVEVIVGKDGFVLTVRAEDVVARAFDHWSDCACHTEPTYPSEHCSCGAMPYRIETK